MTRIDTIVLVHDAFVDGSGWAGVHALLTADGFKVRVAQLPGVSLLGDAAAVRAPVDALDDPCILVGHGYGGAVITEVGIHPKVAGLVYVAAYAPDKGESIASLSQTPGYETPAPPTPRAGYIYLDAARHADAFAGVDPTLAAFMADAQAGWGVAAWTGVCGEPGWRYRPSWYLKVTDDRTIPPTTQAAFAERAGASVSETAGGHAVHISNPEAVAAVIRTAAAAPRD